MNTADNATTTMTVNDKPRDKLRDETEDKPEEGLGERTEGTHVGKQEDNLDATHHGTPDEI